MSKIFIKADPVLETLNISFSSKTMATAAAQQLWKKKRPGQNNSGTVYSPTHQF